MNIKNCIINFFYFYYEVHLLGVSSMHPQSNKKPNNIIARLRL